MLCRSCCRGTHTLFPQLVQRSTIHHVHNARSKYYSQLVSHRNQHILALDFDGVVCDSAHETGVTSLKASKMLWKDGTTLAQTDAEVHVVRSMLRSVRPIVETGYENLILCRYLYDSLRQANLALSADNDRKIAEWQADVVQHILASWSPQMRNSLLNRYGIDKNTLVESFGAARDAIIAENPMVWATKMNPLFPHVDSLLASSSSSALDLSKLYIVTTKQERFVRTILDYHKLPIRRTNIFGLENPHGPKAAVLEALCQTHPDCLVHFVEDRYETLLHILQLQRHNANPLLGRVQLYLVDWGYSQPHHIREASVSQGITVVGPDAFKQLVQRTIGC